VADLIIIPLFFGEQPNLPSRTKVLVRAELGVRTKVNTCQLRVKSYRNRFKTTSNEDFMAEEDIESELIARETLVLVKLFIVVY
jgi:hypothetical protein